jgi:hypothetical protein
MNYAMISGAIGGLFLSVVVPHLTMAQKIKLLVVANVMLGVGVLGALLPDSGIGGIIGMPCAATAGLSGVAMLWLIINIVCDYIGLDRRAPDRPLPRPAASAPRGR